MSFIGCLRLFRERKTNNRFNEFALKTKRQFFYSENLIQETKLLQSAMTKRTLYIPDKNGEQISEYSQSQNGSQILMHWIFY